MAEPTTTTTPPAPTPGSSSAPGGVPAEPTKPGAPGTQDSPASQTAAGAAPEAGAAPQAPQTREERMAAAKQQAKDLAAQRRAEETATPEKAAEPAVTGTEGRSTGYADGAQRGSPEAPGAAGSAEPRPVQVFKDPETGKFLSREEAARRGLVPTGGTPEAGRDGTASPAGAEPAAAATSLKLFDRHGKEIDVPIPAGMAPEHVEALNATAKSGMRRQEYLRQLEEVNQDRAELDEFKGLLTERPEELLTGYLPADKHAAIALALLEDPKVFEEVRATLEEWEVDPSKRVEARANGLQKQLENRDKTERGKQLRQHYAGLERAIINLIPEDADEEQADEFFRDACRDVEDTIRASNRLIGAGEVPQLIARRLRQYGFDAAGPGAGRTPPASASAPTRATDNGRQPGAKSATGSAGTPPPDPRLIATTPQGSAARAGSGHAVPKDINLRTAGDYLRKRFGIARG